MQNKRRSQAAPHLFDAPIILPSANCPKTARAGQDPNFLYNRRMSAIPQIETLKSKLALERSKLLDAVNGLSLTERAEPFLDGWSVNDLLAHVAHSEAINVKFAKLMLASDTPVQLEAVAADFPDYTGPFELDRFNAYMTDKLRARGFDDILSALTDTRAGTLAWMDTLTAEQLERRGVHAAWGDLTVSGMLKILMLHDKRHSQDILKKDAAQI